MLTDLEKAQIMFKLARKSNWGHRYDRTEHFKRFANLNEAIKELAKIGWLIIYKKPKFTGIALNTKHKKVIVDFIEKNMQHIKGAIR